MKPLNATVMNFGSYSKLTFNFSNQGLALIHGATGSGKSTIQDIVPWILYSITAKGGSVDEIRSWLTPDQPTQGILELETSSGVITIYRTRGKPSQNDLYWVESTTDDLHRGKDITETQKLLETRIGITADLYLASAYFNEFSTTGNFFTSKPKVRRELLENIADLSFAVNIGEKASLERKQLKIKLDKLEKEEQHAKGRITGLFSTIQDVTKRLTTYSQDHENTIITLKNKSEAFEFDIQQQFQAVQDQYFEFEAKREKDLQSSRTYLLELTEKLAAHKDRCEMCNQPNATHSSLSTQINTLTLAIAKADMATNPYVTKLERLSNPENPYIEQITIETNKSNPFNDQLKKLQNDLEIQSDQLLKLEAEIFYTRSQITSFNQIYDISFSLRGELLNRSIKLVQDETNRYLEKYFNSEIKILFTAEDSDKLEVEITKNGYDCSYTQLSKGQRCMLKLCFSVSIMEAAANKAGIHMNLLSFDEALDGCDTQNKAKAYRLFEEVSLRHESVLVVEHDENLKNLFDKQYYVELVGDLSYITNI